MGSNREDLTINISSEERPENLPEENIERTKVDAELELHGVVSLAEALDESLTAGHGDISYQLSIENEMDGNPYPSEERPKKLPEENIETCNVGTELELQGGKEILELKEEEESDFNSKFQGKKSSEESLDEAKDERLTVDHGDIENEMDGKPCEQGEQSFIGMMKDIYETEKEKFKEEMKKDIWKIPRDNTTIDFAELSKEWDAVRTDLKQRDCSDLSVRLRIMSGFIFTVIPNCMMVLDFTAAYQYLNGTEYYKFNSTDMTEGCRTTRVIQSWSIIPYQEPKTRICFVRDPIYGGLTLTLTFIAGFFWSFFIFYQYWTYKREDNEQFKKKRMFLVFLPLALLSIVSFPLQLLVISVLSCINDQPQWMTLTSKVGIAEGLFNAHFQWLLQIFIFLYEADRDPSNFQLLAAFGSLLFLALSRVESMTLERRGSIKTPGQKLWWILRYILVCAFNCNYKLFSISFFMVILRYKSIWLYSGVILVWLLIQILFNEGCLPRKYYYLFQGTGIHSLSYTHISDWIKLIEAKGDPNILWVTKLSIRQIRRNFIFQNAFWFLFNTVGISGVLICAHYDWMGDIKSQKVYRIVHFVGPFIIFLGVLLMLNIIYEEREGFTKETKEETGATTAVSYPTYPGWEHKDCTNCEGEWHRYTVDTTLDYNVQGLINQMFYPIVNYWESFIDNSLH